MPWSQETVRSGWKFSTRRFSAREVAVCTNALSCAAVLCSPRAAMEWRRVSTKLETPEDLRELAETAAQEFEDQFSDRRLQELIRAHGTAGG